MPGGKGGGTVPPPSACIYGQTISDPNKHMILLTELRFTMIKPVP
jgi:hypothetical protein